MPALSIVIAAWNGADSLERCLQSLGCDDAEVIVAANRAIPETLREQFPRVRFLSLPETAIVPELRYDQLDGVQDGGMAMDAYREAIHASTTANRKAQIERQLLDYCGLDTLAMVRLWQFFTGRSVGT